MAKTNKKRKNSKRRLLLLILLLVLTIGVAGLQTWSWFTSNKTVSVETLQVQVSAANGLQISADGENWDTTVSLEQLFVAGATYSEINNQLPSALNNVSSPGTYADGLLSMYYGNVVSESVQDSSSGNITTNYYLESSDATTLVSCNDMYTGTKAEDYSVNSCNNAETGKGYYVAFDVYLKVDSDSVLFLDPKSSVKAVGTDKGVKNTARVGLLGLGNTAYDGTDDSSIASSGANARALNGEDENGGTTLTIWEPNAGAHTASALKIAQSSNGYNMSGLGQNMSTPIKYCGIDGTFVEHNETTNIYKLDCANTNTTSTAVNTAPTYTSTSRVDLTNISKPLKAGISKYRVYWWVEGQDIDTENGASGTDMKLTLVLSID